MNNYRSKKSWRMYLVGILCTTALFQMCTSSSKEERGMSGETEKKEVESEAKFIENGFSSEGFNKAMEIIKAMNPESVWYFEQPYASNIVGIRDDKVRTIFQDLSQDDDIIIVKGKKLYMKGNNHGEYMMIDDSGQLGLYNLEDKLFITGKKIKL